MLSSGRGTLVLASFFALHRGGRRTIARFTGSLLTNRRVLHTWLRESFDGAMQLQPSSHRPSHRTAFVSNHPAAKSLHLPTARRVKASPGAKRPSIPSLPESSWQFPSTSAKSGCAFLFQKGHAHCEQRLRIWNLYPKAGYIHPNAWNLFNLNSGTFIL